MGSFLESVALLATVARRSTACAMEETLTLETPLTLLTEDFCF